MVKSNKNKHKNPRAITKTKYRLNARQIDIANKLGLNPKKFGELVPNKFEPWKEPFGMFIERCYHKRFK